MVSCLTTKAQDEVRRLLLKKSPKRLHEFIKVSKKCQSRQGQQIQRSQSSRQNRQCQRSRQTPSPLRRLRPSVCPSLSPACLSVCFLPASVCPPARLSVCPSVYLPVCLSVKQAGSQSIRQPVFLVCLKRLSDCLPVLFVEGFLQKPLQNVLKALKA